ncbi:MAG: YchJ family protein [Desulfobacterales bacterium]|nr:YchJ family protein [Desulfobacterales bacterium]
MDTCPCGSNQAYSDCCEPIINGERPAETPEALMRARYTAHSRAQVDFLLESVHPDHRDQHDAKAVRNWSQRSQWLGLEIRDTGNGGPEDDTGWVEFIAHYREKENRKSHHEIAEFRKFEEKWYFYDGKAPQIEQVVRSAPKVGRNDPCPCGSGKKYKKCCAQ